MKWVGRVAPASTHHDRDHGGLVVERCRAHPPTPASPSFWPLPPPRPHRDAWCWPLPVTRCPVALALPRGHLSGPGRDAWCWPPTGDSPPSRSRAASGAPVRSWPRCVVLAVAGNSLPSHSRVAPGSRRPGLAAMAVLAARPIMRHRATPAFLGGRFPGLAAMRGWPSRPVTAAEPLPRCLGDRPPPTYPHFRTDKPGQAGRETVRF